MTTDFSDLSVVIPAYNEEGGVSATLDGLLAALPGAELVVVDDGSSDRTADVAAAYSGVTLIRHAFNRGYGGALKTGMAVAQREFVAWFDADNEHRVADLLAMVETIRHGNLAAVIGQRTSGGTSVVRGAGKRVILMLARSLGFRGGRDMNCGLRVFRTSVIRRYLSLLPNGYSASITSLMVMLERGYPIEYAPVELGARIGTSKVTLRAGFQALLLVLRVIMMFAPLRIFGPVSAICLSVGVVYSFAIALAVGQGFPVFGVFLMLAGLLIGMLGLIADQLSQMRLSQYEADTRTAIRQLHGRDAGTGTRAP